MTNESVFGLQKEIEGLKNEIKKLKSRKKYGLVWEEKNEDVVLRCKKELPVLVEETSKEIQTSKEKSTNIFIEGDNYHALSVLNYTHKGKVDVIYIDPPYNTGARDWKYNNNYVDSNDGYRHSKWLSMMRSRLVLARHLLKRDGVLVCAIDDNELNTLSLLLNDIYPEKIQNTVVIINNPHGVARSGFSRCHEYALFLLNIGQTVNKKPAPEDVRNINLRRSGNNSLRNDSPTMFYPIFIHKKSLKIMGAGEVPDNKFHPKQRVIERKNCYEVWPIDEKGIEKNWYYSRKRVIEKGSAELQCKRTNNDLKISFYHSNNSEQVYKSVWVDTRYDSGAYGATLVKNLTSNNFPFPKSIHTVLDCLKAVIKTKDAVVLDFFAGSGTTGHAVLELNKEDGGNRQFILCTNNENKIAEEICYPRIKQVINGYKNEKGEKILGLGSNLKYFRTDFVEAKQTDKNKKNLVDKSTEMLCLKEDCFEEVKKGKNFEIFKDNREKYLGIIYDDSGIELFKKEAQKLNKKIITYIFSLDDSAREEEFEDIKKLVELKPIPAVILNVYKKIFK